MSPAWQRLQQVQESHRRQESSGFRYQRHARQGSDPVPTFTMVTPEVLSINVSLDEAYHTVDDPNNGCDLGMTHGENKIKLPHMPRRDTIASQRKVKQSIDNSYLGLPNTGIQHSHQQSMASNSVRNIEPPANVVFPFAAYMPTIDSSTTGFNTPLERTVTDPMRNSMPKDEDSS